MADPVITETHQRTIRVTFERHELKELLVKAALRHAGIESIPASAGQKVVFDDVTEGSPVYRVGQKATVTIDIDLSTAEAA